MIDPQVRWEGTDNEWIDLMRALRSNCSTCQQTVTGLCQKCGELLRDPAYLRRLVHGRRQALLFVGVEFSQPPAWMKDGDDDETPDELDRC